jgi:HK97 family phage prohead protease
VEAPEQRTIDVDVESIDTRGRTLHGYAAVYNVESEDLGGFRERIAPGAFSGVLDADVRALLNHDPSQVLGRTRSGTLRLFDEPRGLRFEVDLPDSPLGENVREAVRRKDIDGASFRFKVDQESWQGDLRTVESVKELKDVTVATFGAYPAASVELRTRNNDGAEERQEDIMENHEERSSEERTGMPAGSLHVEERAEIGRKKSLADEFRAAGFPGETATIDFERFDEYRAVTWTGSVDNINAATSTPAPLGYDQRWVWPAMQNQAVDAGATSVDVMTQTARSLATPANVVRAIDAVTAKPETGSTLTVVTTPLKQVASIETGIPNVYLEQPVFNTTIENDLRLAINDGLDKLVLDAIAAWGFQAPGTDPLLVSIRKATTTLMNAGYNPDTLVLTPANAEALDVLVTGASGAVNDYVFGPGNFATQIFQLNRRISKSIPAAAVLDNTALGKLYTSPVSLARFEADAGTTNRSNVRMELHAAFGVERQAAAVRIAAS